MFSTPTQSSDQTQTQKQTQPPQTDTNEHVVSGDMSMDMIDRMLEQEKQSNKTAPWNRIDKQEKIQKLHKYAEVYGKAHALSVKEVGSLKTLFTQSLAQNKLSKTKEVVCDKETRDIHSIPGLQFNQESRVFILKSMDAKRVSTIKSLTPKRITEKNRDEEEMEDAATMHLEGTD
jgi:hypothetical protein